MLEDTEDLIRGCQLIMKYDNLDKGYICIEDNKPEAIDLLAKKEYTTQVKNTADFALMFIPNEPAYLTAMQGNQQLWEYAYHKHVVIVSPTHLLSVAQLLMQLWSRDKQNKNANAEFGTVNYYTNRYSTKSKSRRIIKG